MANRKIKYSKPSKKSNGLKYDVRFDFMKKAFVIMSGKKIIGNKSFKNVYDAIKEILGK
jgi:hypothetical protein